MNNKVALGIVVILLLISAVDQFQHFTNPLLAYSHALARIIALIMMLANGTFTDRKYYLLNQLLIGGAVLGGLFKILHWTSADQILMLSISGLIILYSIHFATKAPKRVLDILKLITVYFCSAAIILTTTRLIHDPWYWLLRLSSVIISWVTFVWFIIEGAKEKRLFTKENP